MVLVVLMKAIDFVNSYNNNISFTYTPLFTIFLPRHHHYYQIQNKFQYCDNYYFHL